MKSPLFRPPLWATLLTLPLVAGMVTAGLWQYGRGVEKQRLAAQRAAQSAAPAAMLPGAASPPPPGERRAVAVVGMYAPRLTVQLDNQPHRQRPGIHVWTPLIVETGEVVIVDRGWLPLGGAVTDAPAGVQRLRGHWKRLPAPGMRLAAAVSACTPPRPERVTYPSLEDVRCLFGEKTLDGVLELDAAEPGGFTREWATSGAQEIPPARHFAYAGQWGFFALTLVTLYITLNLKRRPDAP